MGGLFSLSDADTDYMVVIMKWDERESEKKYVFFIFIWTVET